MVPEHIPLDELKGEEKRLSIPFSLQFDKIEGFIMSQFPETQILRFVSSRFDKKSFQAHILLANRRLEMPSIFEFQKRAVENEKNFNVCFLIPTGIGCEVGGHAGDGTLALKLIAGSCDKVITHPNVVNAADINEMPENALYVEGSHLTRFLMGTIGLLETKQNKLLVLINRHKLSVINIIINAVNSTRITLGLSAEIVVLDSKIRMEAILEKDKALGKISIDLNHLTKLLDNQSLLFDTIAISSSIKDPERMYETYLKSTGEMINPYGGVEAMLTHIISSKFNKPSAHAPMFDLESQFFREDYEKSIRNITVSDPRMSPDMISSAFFNCVLKGLLKAPKIVKPQDGLSAKDISAIVIPDGTLGLPVLAALHQGIKVIAVKNKNTMKNDLSLLPWKENQFFICNNYLEASGILNCLKQGITVNLIKRPIQALKLQTDKNETEEKVMSSNHSESLSS